MGKALAAAAMQMLAYGKFESISTIDRSAELLLQ
jgi:hypothetical protein